MDKKRTIIVTMALLLSNAMSGLDNTIINTALPRIIADLKGIEYMGWMVSVFLLGTAVATPLWSKLGERTSNKIAYQLAASTFLLGALFQGLAPNMFVLLLARLICGLGNGGMVSIPYIIYSDLYPNPAKRMRTLGLVSAFYSSATIMGPMLGGWIVDTLSWRWVFYLNIPVALISIVLVQIFFIDQKHHKNQSKVDLGGALTLTAGLIVMLIGIDLIGASSLGTLFVLFAAALIFFGLLIIIEKRAEDPVIPGRLFKNLDLNIDFALFVLIWAAMMAFSVYAPMWAQGLLATSAFIGGATQIPGAFTDLCASLSVAKMREHWSAGQVVLIGIGSLLIGYIIMMMGPISMPYLLIIVAGMFQGVGNGIVFNELQVKVQQDVEKKDVPVATSFSFLIRMIASAVAASVFGLIMNSALFRGVKSSHGKISINMLNHLSDAKTNMNLPHDLLPQMRAILYQGIHEIMIVAAILIIASLGIGIYARKREKRSI
ncbi:MFS transporter [Lactobacillus psittaci]|uniref:Permease n=1 Tax=Lactobacillus psittaci DSM 15354 TaxID=1122152 RepID=A0A0R1RY56_9LACO|nr:MFS transporter [Lactobacillus psittaci]KRL61917.1 permease [Lactobacillus psittaci DSM 15354]